MKIEIVSDHRGIIKKVIIRDNTNPTIEDVVVTNKSGRIYSPDFETVGYVTPGDGKYLLSVDIDTDQDATIMYNGISHCFYGQPDLNIRMRFPSLENIVEFLHTEIKVVEGGKATLWVREFIEESCKGIISGETSFSSHGNQMMEIGISED